MANKGTVFDLTLVDKVTTVEGEVIKGFEPKVKKTVEGISSSTWNAIHNGMINVVTVANSASFYDINVSETASLAGKTGTAQQSTTHPDHVLFVGFAPAVNPQIAFATRIANGYASTYTCEIVRDVMKYYYNLAAEDEIVTGTAAEIAETSGHGD